MSRQIKYAPAPVTSAQTIDIRDRIRKSREKKVQDTRLQEALQRLPGKNLAYDKRIQNVQSWISQNRGLVETPEDYQKVVDAVKDQERYLDRTARQKWDKLDFSMDPNMSYNERVEKINKTLEQNMNVFGMGKNIKRVQQFLSDKEPELAKLKEKEIKAEEERIRKEIERQQREYEEQYQRELANYEKQLQQLRDLEEQQRHDYENERRRKERRERRSRVTDWPVSTWSKESGWTTISFSQLQKDDRGVYTSGIIHSSTPVAPAPPKPRPMFSAQDVLAGNVSTYTSLLLAQQTLAKSATASEQAKEYAKLTFQDFSHRMRLDNLDREMKSIMSSKQYKDFEDRYYSTPDKIKKTQQMLADYEKKKPTLTSTPPEIQSYIDSYDMVGEDKFTKLNQLSSSAQFKQSLYEQDFSKLSSYYDKQEKFYEGTVRMSEIVDELSKDKKELKTSGMTAKEIKKKQADLRWEYATLSSDLKDKDIWQQLGSPSVDKSWFEKQKSAVLGLGLLFKPKETKAEKDKIKVYSQKELRKMSPSEREMIMITQGPGALSKQKWKEGDYAGAILSPFVSVPAKGLMMLGSGISKESKKDIEQWRDIRERQKFGKLGDIYSSFKIGTSKIRSGIGDLLAYNPDAVVREGSIGIATWGIGTAVQLRGAKKAAQMAIVSKGLSPVDKVAKTTSLSKKISRGMTGLYIGSGAIEVAKAPKDQRLEVLGTKVGEFGLFYTGMLAGRGFTKASTKILGPMDTKFKQRTFEGGFKSLRSSKYPDRLPKSKIKESYLEMSRVWKTPKQFQTPKGTLSKLKSKTDYLQKYDYDQLFKLGQDVKSVPLKSIVPKLRKRTEFRGILESGDLSLLEADSRVAGIKYKTKLKDQLKGSYWQGDEIVFTKAKTGKGFSTTTRRELEFKLKRKTDIEYKLVQEAGSTIIYKKSPITEGRWKPVKLTIDEKAQVGELFTKGFKVKDGVLEKAPLEQIPIGNQKVIEETFSKVSPQYMVLQPKGKRLQALPQELFKDKFIPIESLAPGSMPRTEQRFLRGALRTTKTPLSEVGVGIMREDVTKLYAAKLKFGQTKITPAARQTPEGLYIGLSPDKKVATKIISKKYGGSEIFENFDIYSPSSPFFYSPKGQLIIQKGFMPGQFGDKGVSSIIKGVSGKIALPKSTVTGKTYFPSKGKGFVFEEDYILRQKFPKALKSRFGDASDFKMLGVYERATVPPFTDVVSRTRSKIQIFTRSPRYEIKRDVLFESIPKYKDMPMSKSKKIDFSWLKPKSSIPLGDPKIISKLPQLEQSISDYSGVKKPVDSTKITTKLAITTDGTTKQMLDVSNVKMKPLVDYEMRSVSKSMFTTSKPKSKPLPKFDQPSIPQLSSQAMMPMMRPQFGSPLSKTSFSPILKSSFGQDLIVQSSLQQESMFDFKEKYSQKVQPSIMESYKIDQITFTDKAIKESFDKTQRQRYKNDLIYITKPAITTIPITRIDQTQRTDMKQITKLTTTKSPSPIKPIDFPSIPPPPKPPKPPKPEPPKPPPIFIPGFPEGEGFPKQERKRSKDYIKREFRTLDLLGGNKQKLNFL